MPAPSTIASLAPALFALMDASQQGFALFDHQDRLAYANPRFRAWMGLLPDEHPSWVELMRIGHARRAGTKVEAQDFETWLASARSRRGKEPYRLLETDACDGRWALNAETTLVDGGMLCVLTDISELGHERRHLRQQRDRARRAAWTDELTGLANRRYLLDRLRELLAVEPGLAVALLDLDHFKRVNDTYGHETGDQVLRHFARVLQQHTGRDDLSGRIGGEEFLLVMRRSAPATAARRVHQLLADVHRQLPLPALPQLRTTASAGLVFSMANETASNLMTRADRLLYAAKDGGRNHCVVEAGPNRSARASGFDVL